MASSLLPRAQVMSDLLTIREKSVLLSLLEPQCKVSSILSIRFKLTSVKYTLTIIYLRFICMYTAVLHGCLIF